MSVVRNEVRQDNFGQFLYYLDLTVDFLERHPEVTVKIKDGVVFLGRSIAGVYREAKTKLTWKMPRIPFKLELPHKRSKHERVSIIKRKIRATKIVEAEIESLPKKEDENESGPKATMTIEQARAEVLKVLAHWIEIKRSLLRLSDCDYIELQKLGFEGVIARLEGIVQQYPALMDENTETSILQFSFNDLEHKRIKGALMIDPQGH